MEALTREGLGLDYRDLRVAPTTEGWLVAGSSLRDAVIAALGADAQAVEQIGSSSVVGLLAKPIIDLAVGVSTANDVDAVRRKLEGAGWIYRGDAGESGGLVFVLEARPWFRVAHLHAVEHRGRQWLEYLLLRDLLRQSPNACARYAAVKLRLIEELGSDRKAYTEAKTDIVQALVRDFTAPRTGGG